MDKQKIEHLESNIKNLEEANRELKNDKDFLIAQIQGAPNVHASTSKSGTKAIQLTLFMQYNSIPSYKYLLDRWQ